MPQEARLKLYNNAMKVRIKSLGLPKAAYGQQVDYGLSLGRGMEGDPSGSLKPKRTIGGVPREEANLEAEGGETVVGQISGDGIVDHMIIKGPRHSSGGVPMNLPDDSFIFSDTASMKIKDPQILQMFGKSKGSYTPAELAKPYDISKYKAILMDPDTDRLSRNTAEIMIKNIVMKLGALALAQEAKKGFPQGIPEIARPYMEANGISEEDLMPELKAQAEQMQAMQQQEAMQMQQAQGMQQPQMQQQGPPQGMPPMMPDGQPVAMPQQGMAPPQQPMMDPRQMMAMQQEQQMMPPQPQQGMPMAAYGMQLGGYDMPFIMGTGGMMRYNGGGGVTVNEIDSGKESAEEVQRRIDEEGYTPGRSSIDTEGAYKIESTPGAEAGSAEYYSGSGGTEAGVAGGICKKIRESNNLQELFYIEGGNPPFPAYLRPRGITPADAGFDDAIAAAIEKLKANPLYTDCIQGVQDATAPTETKIAIHVEPVEDVTEGTCGCPDPEGGTNEDGTPKLINVQTKAALGLAEDEECPPEYCEETTTITENPPNEIAPLPTIPATSFRRGVADPIKPGLDIIGAGERNYIDYRTALQNDQGALEKQIAAIKTMPGVSVGQKQAMIAQVQGQSKAPSIVTDVYNKNVATANELAKSDMALAANQQQLQAGIDGQYNQDLANAENQYTQNVNAARQYKIENAKDNMRMQMMMRSIDNASENFDALGNFVGGTPLQKQLYAACIAAGGTAAKCMAQILGTEPVESETPASAPAPQNTPPPAAPVARYGRIVNPYIMASSVYPWSK